jgi:MFS family permease
VGKAERARILLFYPGYFVGVLAAATVYWLLQRIAHLAVGRHLIGMLGGACVYVATAPVGLVSGEPFDLAAFGAGGAIVGGIIGPAISFALANKPVARHLTETPRGTPAGSPSS